ncbi:MAG: hypothetical protein CYPHOPRED_002050 [Cyphobasidiales sp. Tagirdzhanova-0007]|nr:MAG: hypothetical protein CYPHOPRED_002050 [Cyphobasidiales sp. Tagirdzhanova-0007]
MPRAADPWDDWESEDYARSSSSGNAPSNARLWQVAYGGAFPRPNSSLSFGTPPLSSNVNLYSYAASTSTPALPPPQAYLPSLQILKRPNSGASGSTSASALSAANEAARQAKTLQDRERAYREARVRIFGEEKLAAAAAASSAMALAAAASSAENSESELPRPSRKAVGKTPENTDSGASTPSTSIIREPIHPPAATSPKTAKDQQREKGFNTPRRSKPKKALSASAQEFKPLFLKASEIAPSSREASPLLDATKAIDHDLSHGWRFRKATLLPALEQQYSNTSSPLRNFQLAVPPRVAKDAQNCTIELVHHVFGNSWGRPAVLQYEPPAAHANACGSIETWSSIVLNYSATSNGTQYDRLSSVYLAHVEILRTSTAEPTRGAGIVWTVLKDVTHYARLFSRPGPLLLDLGNGLDKSVNLDGEFDVTLSVTFYSGSKATAPKHPDAILPLSTQSLEQANYFSIDEGGPAGHTLVDIPSTTTEAIVELYASGNAREEFWYTNTADSALPYLEKEAGLLGKGPFREVQLLIDGKLAGTVFPFPVIFSGGIVPTAWRPMIAYGAFDQPTYYLDITPFLPLIAGKKQLVSNALALSERYIAHTVVIIWIMLGLMMTAQMVAHAAPPREERTLAHADGKDIQSVAIVNRAFKIASEVYSGKERHLVEVTQDMSFRNVQKYKAGGAKEKVVQLARGQTQSWRDGQLQLSDAFSYPLSVQTDYSHATSFSARISLGYHRELGGRMRTDVVQRAEGAVELNELGRVVNGTGRSEGRIWAGRYMRRAVTEGGVVVSDMEERDEDEWGER